MTNYTPFKLKSQFKPTVAQQKSIDAILDRLNNGEKNICINGVTGCGKTFLMANLIAKKSVPAVVIAPNKILAGQLFEEFKEFFPDNSVEFFVSYYDYYQPEAYVPGRDLYIEKDSMINSHIDQMRLSATKALFERKDTVIVASVSSIYGLGDPKIYSKMLLHIVLGDNSERDDLIDRLIDMQYSRNDYEFTRGHFRVRGDLLDIYPAELEDRAVRIIIEDDIVASIEIFDPLTAEIIQSVRRFTIYPKTHYVTPRDTLLQVTHEIEAELQERLKFLFDNNKQVEAQRLAQRTRYDIEMIREIGTCAGIENYSRHLTGGKPGEAPPCLFNYLPKDGLLFVDESHLTIPQFGAMYKGDRSRKINLVEYGFRLPSALDNRPLKFEEFEAIIPNTLYLSATPADYELNKSKGVVELFVRPTGLLDPLIEVRPATTQINNLLLELKYEIKSNRRTLVGCLTKRLSEQVCDFLLDNNIKAKYMHSDTNTVERIELIRGLRIGTYDVLVGINLLREGLDLPEVGLVAVLDADREGFLRSEKSLIQMMGRAARNDQGRVLFFADKITPAMQAAMDVSEKRRKIQMKYNDKYNISPMTVKRKIANSFAHEFQPKYQKPRKKSKKNRHINIEKYENYSNKNLEKEILKLEKLMNKHAKNMDFEKAIECRDKANHIKNILLVNE